MYRRDGEVKTASPCRSITIFLEIPIFRESIRSLVRHLFVRLIKFILKSSPVIYIRRTDGETQDGYSWFCPEGIKYRGRKSAFFLPITGKLGNSKNSQSRGIRGSICIFVELEVYEAREQNVSFIFCQTESQSTPPHSRRKWKVYGFDNDGN